MEGSIFPGDEPAKAAIELAKVAYEDTLQPSARLLGKTAESLLFPAWLFVKGIETAKQRIEKSVDEKLKAVDSEKIISPPLHVAVPVIQALSYSMDCDELKNLYANLLATAMQSDKQSQAHPSFVEVIKQMSPLDADMLKTIAESDGAIEIAKYKYTTIVGAVDGAQHITLLYVPGYSDKDISMSLSNLERLGALTLDYTGRIAGNMYEWLQRNDEYMKQNQKFIRCDTGEKIDSTVKSILGIARTTVFGKAFCSACLGITIPSFDQIVQAE